MEKIYTAMGLMSGTSLDGLDLSIIESDGNKEFTSILNRYYEYDKELINKLLNNNIKIMYNTENKQEFLNTIYL